MTDVRKMSYDEYRKSHWKKLTDTEAGAKACVLCGTQPQSIGLHCSLCWNDLADQDEPPEADWGLPE